MHIHLWRIDAKVGHYIIRQAKGVWETYYDFASDMLWVEAVGTLAYFTCDTDSHVGHLSLELSRAAIQ